MRRGSSPDAVRVPATTSTAAPAIARRPLIVRHPSPLSRPTTYEHLILPRLELRVFERDGLRLEADTGQETEPVGAREQALHVSVPLHLNGSVALAQEIGIVHQVSAVTRIRIPRPLQIPQPAAAVVVSAMICGGVEAARLAYSFGVCPPSDDTALQLGGSAFFAAGPYNTRPGLTGVIAPFSNTI